MAEVNKGNRPRVWCIQFTTGYDAEGSQSHIHFDEKLHDSVVMVTQESNSSFLVKLLLPQGNNHQGSLNFPDA
uniref:Adipose-secreted signaling protein n=2 Tax=Sus scrofa TaxID=9823 RepID=A0A8D0Q1U2_PIG